MARTHELLLLETVDNLGIVGDVVNVKTGFARNFLLPRGLATTPTEEKVAELAERRAEAEAELKARISAQQAMIEKLTNHEITLERSANDQGVLFGGVSPHEVAEHLRAEGFEIEDRYVRLGETIKRLDSYDIPIVINKDLKTEIKLWVVSDRPMEAEEDENDEEQGEQNDQNESAETAETASDD